jgi:hypothetical protein
VLCACAHHPLTARLVSSPAAVCCPSLFQQLQVEAEELATAREARDVALEQLELLRIKYNEAAEELRSLRFAASSVAGGGSRSRASSSGFGIGSSGGGGGYGGGGRVGRSGVVPPTQRELLRTPEPVRPERERGTGGGGGGGGGGADRKAGDLSKNSGASSSFREKLRRDNLEEFKPTAARTRDSSTKQQQRQPSQGGKHKGRLLLR